MQADLKKPTFALYKRLLRTYVRRYWKILLLGMVCMLVVAATTGAQAYMIKPLLDKIFVDKNAFYLTWLPVAIVVIFTLNSLADFGQSIALRYVGQRALSDMQGDLFAHLMHADISLFHDQSSGRLISRMTNDIMLMRQSVSQVITGIVKETTTLVFLLALMFMQSFTLSLLAFGVLFFAILPIMRLGKRMRKISDATQNQLGDFTAQLDDTFQGVRIVKSYGREDFETVRARDTIRRLFKLYYRAAKVQSAAGPIMNEMTGFAIAGILWYGGFKVFHGELTAGEFGSFLGAMIVAYRPIKVIAGLNTQLQEGMAAAGRFFAVIDTKPGIDDAPNAKTLAVTRGEIAFNHVSFHYPESEAGVEGLSFIVPAGKTVALVGSSGSGKSTIMNLLLRFYEVQEGGISIDGTDIRNVTLASLRASLALVSQEIVLFNDTVRANIAYGKLDATEAEIIAAAKKAHADEFIRALPQGYDTPIGPLGVKLSGGQRQRLSIARAVLKNAPILLLDEATSALDNASERAVQEALTELMQGRTTLVIAHRLSTIQDADTILVLDQGRIRDTGTHNQLIVASPIYREMQQLTQQASTS